jgi:haloacetate dehalogenase
VTLLDGFARADRVVDGVRIATWVAGTGPPLLLLHGYPQTHLMWHAVAPRLIRRFTVVLTDLRGYGESDKPPAGPEHAAYAKRAMAADQVGVMAALGFDAFALVGHDRGGRVGHRLALDHPERVTRLAVVDIAPTHHMLTTADLALARAYFHWFFLSQPPDLPERMIGADPDAWTRSQLQRGWAATTPMDPEAMAAYLAAGRDPSAIAGACGDYRAALGVDLDHDQADRHRRVTCPLLVIWGQHGFIAARYDPVAAWCAYASDVRGVALPAGHFVPEEDPQGTLSALEDFLGG